jgi:hypothetical protein
MTGASSRGVRAERFATIMATTFALVGAGLAWGWGLMTSVRISQTFLSRVRGLAAPLILSIAILGGLFLLANQTVSVPFLYRLVQAPSP